MRLVTVTPAGRRRYLEILASYLLRNRHVIDEHRWWVNTRDQGDIAYLHWLVDRWPDFFKLVDKPFDPSVHVGPQIWQFMSDCVEPETVYLRLDDDICYIAEDAIEKMYEHRLANPEPFLTLGSIVNNSVCTHYYQKMGIVPERWGHVELECEDVNGWLSGEFARKVHTKFLEDLDNGYQGKWRGLENDFDGLRRFSINVICWRGEDMALVDERYHPSLQEELIMTTVLPQRFNRPMLICPDALFSHYAFFPQRKYLERVAPAILERYWRHAMTGASRRKSLAMSEKIRLGARSTVGNAWFYSREVIHGAKYALKRVTKGKKAVTPKIMTNEDRPEPGSKAA